MDPWTSAAAYKTKPSQTRSKQIKKARKRKLKWNMKKVKENDGKEIIEQKCSKIYEFPGSIEHRQEKVKETLWDKLNNDIGKTEIASRKSWITQEMINRMEERRKANHKLQRIQKAQ